MSQTNTYTISGMTCDHCARTVRAEVGAIEGVTNVDVDVDVASGGLSVTSVGPVPIGRLRDAVTEAGYTLLG